MASAPAAAVFLTLVIPIIVIVAIVLIIAVHAARVLACLYVTFTFPLPALPPLVVHPLRRAAVWRATLVWYVLERILMMRADELGRIFLDARHGVPRVRIAEMSR